MHTNKYCYVCGDDNDFGLRATTTVNDDEVKITCTPPEQMQKFGILHNGVITALIDEAIGIVGLSCFGSDSPILTAKLDIFFFKTVSIEELIVVARRTHKKGRVVKAVADVRLQDDTLIAIGLGTVMRCDAVPGNPTRETSYCWR